jgi:hypothetical protein
MAEFVKTEKQQEACRLLNAHEHSLLYGGSRSGKTAIKCRNLILRGLKKPSRHLIVRFRFNHVVDSIGLDTLPKIFDQAFPGLDYEVNKSRWIFEFESRNGGTSQIWLGGIDDKIRSEKVLGQEYSSILANEISQIPYRSIVLLWTRLAENSGLDLRFYYDCNPPSKTHWSYAMFFEGRTPEGIKHSFDTAKLQMNPIHNRENLPDSYFKILDNLPERSKKRFRDGLYVDDVEGSLWTLEMLTKAKVFERGEIQRITVSIDPSVSNTEHSDECGIVICGVDDHGIGGAIADWSGKMSTAAWADRAVKAYHHFGANDIVAEKNQGGTLVEDAIHNVDRHIKVELVHASKGKKSRAQPVAQLFEEGQVGAWFDDDMPELEDEMTTHNFDDPTEDSPNRVDAMVWGFFHLVIGKGMSEYHFQ